jgi:hypothetical protein
MSLTRAMLPRVSSALGWRSALLASLLAPVGAACSSTKTGGATNPPAEGDGAAPSDAGTADAATSSEAGSDAGVVALGARWVGRVDVSDPTAPTFAWSGTGFIATVSGSTISVKLKTIGSSDPIYFQPVIDGTPGARFAVPTGELTTTLASNLTDADHVVEVYRETEGRYGNSVFEGFTDGTPKDPPAPSGRLIEIVGDSISAGYGDLGSEQHPDFGPDPDGGCPFSTMTESAYATYGALAARALNADPSIVAVSGWGIYRDNGNSTSNVLPLVYADTLGLSPTPVWGFQPEPQAVVINLGTNDFANGDPGQAAFEGAYTAFIGTVRGKYPDAWVLCTVGPLLFGTGLTMAQTYIQDVVSAAQSSGDMKVRYLDFGEENTSLGTGCQYHPNTTEHQTMATELVSALQADLGW